MKGRLFLACRKEVVRRKEDIGLFACEGQYLWVRYFRCVHTTRKSSVSCAGQIAGKGVRVIEWHYHVIASWVRKACLSNLIAAQGLFGEETQGAGVTSGVFPLGCLDHLAFSDLTFFLSEETVLTHWKVTISSIICHLLFSKQSRCKGNKKQPDWQSRKYQDLKLALCPTATFLCLAIDTHAYSALFKFRFVV